MRPDVYPRTLENIKAVLLHYFPKTSHTEIDKNAERIYDQRKFKLNELEYCCEVVTKNVDVIREYYKALDLNILLIVGYDVLFEDEKKWGGTSRRAKLEGIKAKLVF
ncbi:hypothetical protein [Marixanthomonas spongiae]|uniref:Uncharacterized protein n=1 Tax=Marixanthomonas spongiae TaxID=2174845 RepID=A0A2U0I5I3_9FLAO|nr:hypothetical protein [Marixanthomonas spongiae]PVW16270.1 hypothetical protein DDV96_03095 [Marixanthomonas spongiae]